MKKYILILFIISIILALFSPFASSFPDGLEKVSEIFNFQEKERTLISSPMPDYTIPLVQNVNLSTILSGIFGVIITFISLYLLGLVFKKKID
ncbi:MAG: PDGLE domain-containing protein [Caldisericia bacterium]|jgi:cobalt/nickel transport protein|nr:PDGLE domain-containing protein [Caldisericia bacterium]